MHRRITELLAKARHARELAAVTDQQTAANLNSFAADLEAEAARLDVQMSSTAQAPSQSNETDMKAS